MSQNPSSAPVLERLIAHFGSQLAFARNLGVPKNYPTRWLDQGFITEAYALDVHDLRVVDDQGTITAMDVLSEARAARAANVARAMAEGGP